MNMDVNISELLLNKYISNGYGLELLYWYVLYMKKE